MAKTKPKSKSRAKSKSSKSSSSIGFKKVRFGKWPFIAFVIAFAAIGTYMLRGSFALNSASKNPSVIAMRPQIVSLMRNSTTELTKQTTPADPQFYGNNHWYAAPAVCGPCLLGPAAMTATTFAESDTSNTLYLRLPTGAVNWVIDNKQNADGSIGDKATPDTQFYGNEIGATYLELQNYLDPATKTKWKTAMTRAADFLVTSGNSTFYINGNINLGQTLFFYEVWKATGIQHYNDLYEQSLAFTLSPPQNRFPGFGLKYTINPTAADGSNGSGYLAEKGSGAPGYDGDYTQLQLSVASRWYVFSQDARALRLVNLFANQLLPHVDANWVLDATNGSRHSLKMPFTSSGLFVLAWLGGRTQFNPKLQDQFSKVISPSYFYNASQNWGSGYYYRGYGLDLGTILKASQIAK